MVLTQYGHTFIYVEALEKYAASSEKRSARKCAADMCVISFAIRNGDVRMIGCQLLILQGDHMVNNMIDYVIVQGKQHGSKYQKKLNAFIDKN